MERVIEELDEARSEIEKLREELKGKAELSENLKRSYNDQVRKAQEASLKIEKQAQEINEKGEEISALKETSRELQDSLKEKESIVNHLCVANEKLRVSCDEKLKKREEENVGLTLALEEANGKSFDKEQQIQVCKEEIESLKGCLSALQKKCLEAETRGNRTKEAREREGVLLGLEEEKGKIEEQLKWKNEQFSHLKEAHQKMKVQFKASEKEWELEKSSLLDEICSLQSRLDSQTRISEDLQNRLHMCHQVLAREETRRKSVEAQLSEVQGRFENVFGDYQDAKSQLESLTEKRDEEIASLRHSLSKKEAVLKEIEYQKRQMEQDNEDLQNLLKEYQESQIQKASGSPSVAKLRNKLKCSEQMHRESIANLKAKEAELNSQLEKMADELNGFGSLLKCKDEMINELRLELKQMHEKSASICAKEVERKFEMEKVTNDLKNCKDELEGRDVVIEELRMALENFHAREVEWKSRMEATTEDLEKNMSQLDSKDEMISNLKMELERLQEESSGELATKESERSSQIEKMKNDLNNQKLLVESRDATVKELGMELEQVRREFAAKLQALEAEWKSQVETVMNDLKKCSSQLEKKDHVISELKLEFEQQHEDYCAKLSAKEAESMSELEKVTNDLTNYCSALESKDAKIKALRLELDQLKGDFVESSKTKGAEWGYQLEMITEDLNKCRSERDDRDAKVKELRMDLESKDVKIKALALELEQIRGDFDENLKTKEDEWTYQLEMITEDLNNCRSERDDRHAKIKELRRDLEIKDAEEKALGLELGQVKGDFVQNLKSKEAEWTRKLEMIMEDLDKCRSERDCREVRIKKLGKDLESKDAQITALRLELEKVQEDFVESLKTKEAKWSHQLEIITGDLNMSRSERDDRDMKIKALGFELEQVQKDFVETLKTKEAEWNHQLETISRDLNKCRSERDDRDMRVKELAMELENCHAVILQPKLQNEEISVMMLVMKDGIIDAQSKIASKKAEMDRSIKEREENVSQLRRQLEEKNAVINRLQKDVGKERENAGKEINRYEEMLMESSICELFLKEQILQIESVLEKKLKKACKELERTRFELAERICQGNGAEFELYIWKSIAENFKVGLEESFKTRQELEVSLLAQVVVGETIEQEKQRLVCLLEERDSQIADLQRQVLFLESQISNFLQESLGREIDDFLVAKIGEEKRVEDEKEKASNLMRVMESLESKFNSSLISFSTQLAEKQAEIDLAREKNEEKKHMIAKIDEAKEMEVKKASEELKAKLKSSGESIKELEDEKRNLLADVTKLLSERENTLAFIGGLDARISELSSVDQSLTDMLEGIVLSCDPHSLLKDSSGIDVKENMDSPATSAKLESHSEIRLPFREINH